MLKIIFQYYRKFTRNLLEFIFAIYYEDSHDRTKREQKPNH